MFYPTLFAMALRKSDDDLFSSVISHYFIHTNTTLCPVHLEQFQVLPGCVCALQLYYFTQNQPRTPEGVVFRQFQRLKRHYTLGSHWDPAARHLCPTKPAQLDPSRTVWLEPISFQRLRIRPGRIRRRRQLPTSSVASSAWPRELVRQNSLSKVRVPEILLCHLVMIISSRGRN